MTIKNATRLPEVFFGLHMVPGVAEYREPTPHRILINGQTIKNMDASFKGRPVYVEHVNAVDLANIQQEADGYVIRSFFNQADGMHWAEFIVVSDRGHEAIANGWRLSNAYVPKSKTHGGLCNGVEYQEEITAGEYEHLAIVPNPRYEQSRVLTAEQFKSYNAEKVLELQRLTNSLEKNKKGAIAMLNFFKKTKVENSADFEGMSVTLPKSKKEVTLEKLINDADAMADKGCYANGEHKVKVGEEEMTVNELIEKYAGMAEATKVSPELKVGDEQKLNEGKEEEKKENEEEKKEEKKENDEDEEALKKMKELEGHEKKEIAKKNNIDEYTALINAGPVTREEFAPELIMDQVARGKKRYGSGK